MEIIDYVWSDWFVHHILNNSWGIPFELYFIVLMFCPLFIYLVIKKILW